MSGEQSVIAIESVLTTRSVAKRSQNGDRAARTPPSVVGTTPRVELPQLPVAPIIAATTTRVHALDLRCPGDLPSICCPTLPMFKIDAFMPPLVWQARIEHRLSSFRAILAVGIFT